METGTLKLILGLSITLLVPKTYGQTEDWHDFGDQSFHITSGRLTYTQAKERCESFGGRLATLDNAEKNAFATALIAQPTGNRYYWFGLNDIEVEGAYVWVDGTPVSTGFRPWRRYKPGTGWRNGDCGYITRSNSATENGKWGDGWCTYTSTISGAICQRPAQVEDWRELFHITYGQLTYTQATERCESLGGHLAILDTPEKNAFAIALISEPRGNRYYWFGLNDMDVEGEYVWVDGTPVGTEFRPWRRYKPGTGWRNGDCGYITRSNSATENGKWGDGWCTFTSTISGAICQQTSLRK